MKSTKRCIMCLVREAVEWTGYVTKHDEPDGVLAGWCKQCLKHEQGFSGHWRREMGILQE